MTVARNKLGAPMFEHKSLSEAIVLLEKIVVTLLGLFGAPAMVRRPRSDFAPVELCHLALLFTPLV